MHLWISLIQIFDLACQAITFTEANFLRLVRRPMWSWLLVVGIKFAQLTVYARIMILIILIWIGGDAAPLVWILEVRRLIIVHFLVSLFLNLPFAFVIVVWVVDAFGVDGQVHQALLFGLRAEELAMWFVDTINARLIIIIKLLGELCVSPFITSDASFWSGRLLRYFLSLLVFFMVILRWLLQPLKLILHLSYF